MKINHEETKETKKEQKIPMRVRIFVVDFPRSRTCRERRRETTKKCGAGWKPAHSRRVGRLETCPTLFLRSRSCRERRPDTIKINHEVTKYTKKEKNES